MRLRHAFAVAALVCSLAGMAGAAGPGDSRTSGPVQTVPTYADLVDLADGAPLVVRAQIRGVTPIEPARARGVRPGWIRVFVEARTEAVIGGSRPLGERIVYLTDVRADARGKPPKLKKVSVLLFARAVDGRPGELQLVAPDAQLPWDAGLEARVRAVLAELYAPGAPQKINGVREALHVSGSLAGEGETQIFLSSANGEPASLTVSRSSGAAVRYSASFSELVGSGNGLPPKETLAWYRLACFLPARLPAGANIAEAADDRAAAALDYRAALEQLGDCPRTRR